MLSLQNPKFTDYTISLKERKKKKKLWTIQTQVKDAKGLVAELAFSHSQNAWGSRGERVRAAGLAVCCNYLSKIRVKDQTLPLSINAFKFVIIILFINFVSD